jgi:predicted  nucleic acid-binding Zn-ribbon protein
LKLLDVQELDSKADVLRHQRAHLPETAEIAALEASRRELDAQARDARVVRDDLEAAQQKAEADVEAVRARRQRDQNRLDQGVVTQPKDLEHLQSEVANLQRRISVLEDEELAVMEELETAQATLGELETKVAEADERLAALAESRERRTAEIDAQLASLLAGRPGLVADMPADLLGLYDRLREQKGGAGAAELRARQCGGCMLSLDSAELNRIRALPSDEVVRCEECSRILVRTAESGL